MDENFRAYVHNPIFKDVLDAPHETWVDQYEALAANLELLMEAFSLGRNDLAYETLALMERNVVYAREWMEAHELESEEAKARVKDLWNLLNYNTPSLGSRSGPTERPRNP